MEWAVISMIILIVGIVVWGVYEIGLRDYLRYRKAKREIYAIVINNYKARATGQNRFVVTIETLKASFPDYEEKIIQRVWFELIHDKVIAQHPMDNEWGIQ